MIVIYGTCATGSTNCRIETPTNWGVKVGAALLLDGYVYKAGMQQKLKVSPAAAYLCRTVDSDYPNWPIAAASLPGIPASSGSRRATTSS
jgi:hypothetical protein